MWIDWIELPNFLTIHHSPFSIHHSESTTVATISPSSGAWGWSHSAIRLGWNWCGKARRRAAATNSCTPKTSCATKTWKNSKLVQTDSKLDLKPCGIQSLVLTLTSSCMVKSIIFGYPMIPSDMSRHVVTASITFPQLQRANCTCWKTDPSAKASHAFIHDTLSLGGSKKGCRKVMSICSPWFGWSLTFFSFWGSLLMATMTPLLWRFWSQATSENSMEMLLAPQTAPTDSLPEAP